MPTICSRHRTKSLPQPIRSADELGELLAVATDFGRDVCTAVIGFDGEHRPRVIVQVTGAPPSSAKFADGLEMVLEELKPAIDAVILATSRPDATVVLTPDDAAAWPVLEGRCSALGLWLVDWFVLSGGEHVRSVPRAIGADSPRSEQWIDAQGDG